MGAGMTTSSDEPALLSVLLMRVPDPEADPEDAERATRQLRAEIDDVDWETLEVVSGPEAPDQAKGDPVTVGAFLLALSASGGVLPSLINTIRDWLGRQGGSHRIAITIDGDTIELDRASAEQQRQLVDAFVHRHSGP
jgi:hypothetical protein